MNFEMKISIITVCFNSSETIKATLQSITSQTYKNIEHIIIDGSSKDNTLEIISAFSSNSIVISETDNGIYDAMNKGIEMATGNIIAILNSDDIYQDSTVIEDVVTCFINDSVLDIVYGDIVYVNRNDTEKVIRRWKSSSYYPYFFENGNVPPHPALFVKSRVYKEAGLFNLNYNLAADYEFMLRIFKKHQFKAKYLKRLILKMRLGGATNKSFLNIIKGNKEIILAWKNNGLKVPLRLMPLKIIRRILQFT